MTDKELVTSTVFATELAKMEKQLDEEREHLYKEYNETEEKDRSLDVLEERDNLIVNNLRYIYNIRSTSKDKNLVLHQQKEKEIEKEIWEKLMEYDTCSSCSFLLSPEEQSAQVRYNMYHKNPCCEGCAFCKYKADAAYKKIPHKRIKDFIDSWVEMQKRLQSFNEQLANHIFHRKIEELLIKDIIETCRNSGKETK